MENMINQIFDWPALAQAVIGACLFAILLKSGSWLSRFLSNKAIGFSKNHRLNSLIAESIRYKSLVSTDSSQRGALIAALIYAISGYTIKAIIMVVLGLAFSNLSIIFGYVGYIMALYYLFIALDRARDVDMDVNLAKKIEELQEKIDNIKNT